MKFLFVLAAVAAVAYGAALSESQFDQEWAEFKINHSKTYETEAEETLRKDIYKENRNKIESHNARYRQGEVTYTVAVNKFADMLAHEITATRTGFNQYGASSRVTRTMHRINHYIEKPSSIDWREKGCVTAVKNQGSCGGSWAFSTVGALEAALFRSTGTLTSLSEQQLLDCSSHNAGCNRGNMIEAFIYVIDNKGIDTDTSYAFEGQDGSCRYSASNSAGHASKYVGVGVAESLLQDAVATVGPVSVGIDASQWGFNYYDSGIYYDEACSTNSLNHAALVVGFGSDGPTRDYWYAWGNEDVANGPVEDYWIVKNSWGTDWGEDGYIRMARNKHNNCGIASMATYPEI